jgi:phage replication O-like protein O
MNNSHTEPNNKGFAMIPNQLLVSLYELELSGAGFRIILLILRKTIGWHKEADWISFTKFQKEVKLSRYTVAKELKRLKRAKIILVSDGLPLSYKINTDTESWVVSDYLLVSDSLPPSKRILTTLVSDNLLVTGPKDRQTRSVQPPKYTTKYTNTKYIIKFNEFWNLYPRKQSRVDAEKKYKILVKDGYHDSIIEGLQRYLRYWRQHKTEPRYIPLPTSWLNAQRWNDDLDLKPVYQERKLDLPPGWVPPPPPKRANSDLLKISRERLEELKRTGLFLNTT